MPQCESLLDYFQLATRPASEAAVVWRKSYRRERWTYETLLANAKGLACELRSRGISKGDRALLWGENSGEWIAAFLACLFCGAISVPLDAIGERSFAERVAKRAGARLAIVSRELNGEGIAPEVIALEDIAHLAATCGSEPFEPQPARHDDPVEIVFTSGTTAEPRGVVITHGNILANLAPIEREFEKYRRYERFVHPIRILNLLPLSHVFGQFLGIILPQVLGLTVAFTDTLNPAEVIREIGNEKISVLIAVPRLIESLQGQLERDLAASGQTERFKRAFDRSSHEHFLRRWWRFRKIRRRFGWKFWAFVSGGAALPSETEKFWHRLGYAVIQGYGLTETTSLVSLNHPFRTGQGSIGRPMSGGNVKLSPEGEILVRGENIASGYWDKEGITPATDAGGWFHTGDLGELDAAGNLYFKGRSKNVIVTPEGLKVYPADLETELRREPAIRDCVVIGLDVSGNAEACAVLLLHAAQSESATKEAAAAVQNANQRLAPFQQMRRWIIWPDQDFPRTPTQKPMLGKIREAAEAQLAGRTTSTKPTGANDLLARFGAGSGANEPLQLSSVERVELISELEDRYQIDLSEADFASADSAAALEKLLQNPPPQAQHFQYPTWPLSWPARLFRSIVLNCVAFPAMLVLGWPRIKGRKKLAAALGSTPPPSLVISNHIVYLDPAYILLGLPRAVRRRVAIAMDGELLESYRTPPPGTNVFQKAIGKLRYLLLVSIFNVFPLPRRAGFQRSFAFIGSLIDRGWNVLIFPEGELTKDGSVAPFRAGIGLLASRLCVPVIPAYLDGLWQLKKAGRRGITKPFQIGITVGLPQRFAEDESAEKITETLQRQVEALGAASK